MTEFYALWRKANTCIDCLISETPSDATVSSTASSSSTTAAAATTIRNCVVVVRTSTPFINCNIYSDCVEREIGFKSKTFNRRVNHTLRSIEYANCCASVNELLYFILWCKLCTPIWSGDSQNYCCIWWFCCCKKQKRILYIRMFWKKSRRRKYYSVSSQYNIIHFNVVRLNLTMYRPICVHSAHKQLRVDFLNGTLSVRVNFYTNLLCSV